MFANPFVLLDAAAGTPVAGGGSSMIIMILVMFAIMYFLMIRPEQKKRNSRTHSAVTIGGITGKVVQVTDDTVTFETGEDRVRIQVKKWGISTTAKYEAAKEAQKKTGAFGARKKS